VEDKNAAANCRRSCSHVVRGRDPTRRGAPRGAPLCYAAGSGAAAGARRPTKIASAGSTTATVPLTASAAAPHSEYASPPSSASDAPRSPAPRSTAPEERGQVFHVPPARDEREGRREAPLSLSPKPTFHLRRPRGRAGGTARERTCPLKGTKGTVGAGSGLPRSTAIGTGATADGVRSSTFRTPPATAQESRVRHPARSEERGQVFHFPPPPAGGTGSGLPRSTPRRLSKREGASVLRARCSIRG
jgi:hypothetical protein